MSAKTLLKGYMRCTACGRAKPQCRFPFIRGRTRSRKCKQCLLFERLEEAERGNR